MSRLWGQAIPRYRARDAKNSTFPILFNLGVRGWSAETRSKSIFASSGYEVDPCAFDGSSYNYTRDPDVTQTIGNNKRSAVIAVPL